jgi:hypothetical protein
MTRSLALVLTSASALAFAAPSIDKDGVPVVDLHGTIVEVMAAKTKPFHVPAVRKRMVKVGDQQMPLREFLATYCQGKYQNATCVRGSKINSIDGSSGPQATLPKGL